MSKKERILGRLGKIGSQVFVSAASMRSEIESLSIERLERLSRRLNLVRRDEFEALQAMLKEARLAQEDIRARLKKLEVNSSLTNTTRVKTPVKKQIKKRAKKVLKPLKK
jgi:BMFP domain-containing protein YqiC